MATETQEEKLKVEVKVTRHTQDNGLHCLGLDVADGHVAISSHPYNHRRGSHAGIDIYDLTLDDLVVIGQAIIAETIKIQMETK